MSCVWWSPALPAPFVQFDAPFVHTCVRVQCACPPPSHSPILTLAGAGAQQILQHRSIPQISYASSSPELSDADLYPTFFRTPPSDDLQAEAVADFLLTNLGFSQACIVNTDTDSYSVSGANAFEHSFTAAGGIIVERFFVPDSPTYEEVVSKMDLLAASTCR